MINLWQVQSCGSHNIPCVEHELFMSYNHSKYISNAGNFSKMFAYAQEHGFNLVCKSNDGSSGKSVFLITTPLELEQACINIFSSSEYVCLSPFYNIKHEYRSIILNGKTKLFYRKIRPHVIGNRKKYCL